MAEIASISIIKSPPTIALLGEGLKYELQRNYPSTTGAAVLTITLSTTWADYPDKNMVLGTITGDLTFSFKASPDQSGNQIQLPLVGDTISEYAAKVASDLQKNYYINQNYIVTVGPTGKIIITAREIGAAYNLNLISTTVTGLSEFSNVSGVDDSTDADYKFYAAICQWNIDPFLPEALGEEMIPVVDQQIAHFNPKAYLEDQVETSFHFPFNGTLVYEVQNAVIRYFIRFAEYKLNQMQKVYNDQEVSHFAIAGGLNRLDSDFLKGEGSNYFDYMDYAKRPLTWQPSSKITYPDTSERLFFYLIQENCIIKKKDYYADSSIIVSNLETLGAGANKIIEIACGTKELFYDTDISDLVKYEIWIEDDKGDILMDAQTFIIDHDFYLNTRTLFFKNSFKMFDVLHSTGDLTVKDSVVREEIHVLTDDVFRRRVLLAENKMEYQLNSGWLAGKETRFWLEDLLLSEEVYLTLGDFILPVVMTTGKVTRHQDRKHNYSLAITFEPDYDNSRHSAIVGEGAYFYTDANYVIYTDENGVKFIE
jgi:hypothetical protein